MTTYNETKLDSVSTGFGLAAVITIIFNTILTIVKESYPPVLAFMKSVSILGIKHHWLVHGLTLIILFTILGWIFSKSKYCTSMSGIALAKAIAWTTFLGSLLIVFFYLFEMVK